MPVLFARQMYLFAQNMIQVIDHEYTQTLSKYKPLFSLVVGDAPRCFLPSITICFSASSDKMDKPYLRRQP